MSPEPKLVFAKEQQAHSEVKAEAGASATLSCEVAQAQTEVTWFKDGKKLSSSSKVRVEASGCSRRLVVQQAGKADAGEYSCEAGGQKLSFRLDVTGGCRATELVYKCYEPGYGQAGPVFCPLSIIFADLIPVSGPGAFGGCLFILARASCVPHKVSSCCNVPFHVLSACSALPLFLGAMDSGSTCVQG